jgi:uncharacterized membrane protein YgaE (UPF0421/DUF939 family)
VPFVAPVAAIAVIGISYGQQARRAVEVALGVALGILVADAIVIGLGGGTLVIGLVVALAMVVAVLLGGGRTVVSQAAISAAIVATIEVPETFTGGRALDALAGGTVALALGLLLFPLDPVRLLRGALAPVLATLEAVFDDVADALADRDHDRAVDALLAARALDRGLAGLADAATTAQEVAAQAPLRRRGRGEVRRLAARAAALDLVARNARVVARSALRAIDTDEHVPDEDVEAVRRLARAVSALREDDDAAARAATLEAAALATAGMERTGNLAATHLVGQLRMTATDVLRALGDDPDAARTAVRRAAPGV